MQQQTIKEMASTNNMCQNKIKGLDNHISHMLKTQDDIEESINQINSKINKIENKTKQDHLSTTKEINQIMEKDIKNQE